MSPPPGGVTARCTVCGEAIRLAHPDEDVCCVPCFTLNFALAVHLEPPVVRPALALSEREHQALRVYQRHVEQVEGTGACTPLVTEEEA